MIGVAVWWACGAVLLALLEIEIEGKYGWAEKLPTWYRSQGRLAKLFSSVTSGKPLTGYHLFLHALILWLLHMPFVYGMLWSWRAEASQCGWFLLFWVVEDWSWFVLNPHYGMKRFKQSTVWWFAKSRWVCGIIPLDYPIGFALFALLQWLAGHGATDIVGSIAVMLVAIAVTALLAGPYRRWHDAMRTRDDRTGAGIFHDDEPKT